MASCCCCPQQAAPLLQQSSSRRSCQQPLRHPASAWQHPAGGLARTCSQSAQCSSSSGPQERRRVACSAFGGGGQGEPVPSVAVAVDPLHPISGRALDPAQCVPPTALFLGVAGLAVAFVLRVREKKSAIRERPDVDAAASRDGGEASDPRHHQRVLAKARQSTHISSAVTYYKTGEYTKAKLELAKALAENSICRAPAVLAHTSEEMANLYRLHIRYTEQPPSFATLLQLQEMLGISQEEAERIEYELLRSPGTFAI